ncbi:rhodanese-related sulfurtransferase [Alteraurantiacibacter aestuarii]|uniref:tRNA uridine(34) hydroxylase n=1 Tax=Alteraurantiacibacter aestuarii TaxID=650004 RepID=A0A844ZJJ8_9SPHN|nr:rhodanese-related sulfurtransferase [Alteraurantiacibacter aestuarii]MXO87965.1 rhodanese-related sulfurtransferase [Alteraurantiacibacter aestuarii]
MTSLPICVAALYQFTRFTDCAAVQAPLQQVCDTQGIKGTILIAEEGINGTIAGTDDAIAAVLGHIRALPGCADIGIKFSRAAEIPFIRMKVRLKKEIVTLGQPGVDPVGDVGTYVDPQDWNALIADPDTIVIDTRNDYEVSIGQFEGAIDPRTTSFRDFPAWFRARRAELLGRTNKPRVAMYCTGGIRCEKSTAFLRSEGIEDVYHLKGGILSYLEHIPEEESRWRGECFVFDERVSVGHGLQQGDYTLCRACRHPLDEEDRASEFYENGVSCPHCHAQRTPQQRSRYAERQKQMRLARKRGQAHVGARLAGTDDR